MTTPRPIPELEFDERKNQIDKLKHGIDFVEAQALWLDERLRELNVVREGEARYRIVGTIGSRYWTAVITCRGVKVRLISVRRARAEEVDEYGR